MTATSARNFTPELDELRSVFKKHRGRLRYAVAARWVFACTLLNVPKIINNMVHKWTGSDLPGWLFITLLIICFLGMVLVGLTRNASSDVAEWQNDVKLRSQLERLEEIATISTKSDLNTILPVLWEARDGLYHAQLSRTEEHLAPLILHLEPGEAPELQREARLYLRDRARNSTTPEMRIAALLVLGELKDRTASKLARLAQASTDERLIAAGEEVLRAQGIHA